MTGRALIQQRYQAIAADGMADIPVCNPNLTVVALGFDARAEAELDGRPLGVLVTPWCMNLMLLPGAEDHWTQAECGREWVERFPSGDYRFVQGWDEVIGAYGACSLFSPMFDFADQTAAEATAEAALTALFDENTTDTKPATNPAAGSAQEADPKASAPTPAKLSRRGFLTGGWRRAKEDGTW